MQQPFYTFTLVKWQIIHLYTGAVMRDLVVGQPKTPTGKQTKHSPVINWSSPSLFHKAPHL